MTPALQIELGYRGIFPDIAATYHRQTCPQCSPYRQKRDEPCLVTTIISATEADVICHHCTQDGKPERIRA